MAKVAMTAEKEDFKGMSVQLVWQDRYNIGVDIIDKEHKKLFRIMNSLFNISEQQERSQWVCQEGIKYFKDHAMRHFSEEEVYMASIHYMGYDRHRRLHDTFRKKTLPALEQELKQSNYSPDSVDHFLSVCAGWLIGHTLTEDYAITGKTMSKWVNLLPEEELAAMGQVIIQILYDMFRLEAQVISDNYGGEKFGKGIYYRLVYENGKKEQMDTILIFEEKLIVNTIGQIISDHSNEVNVMLLNAVRYTARQFVERVRQYFPDADQYEMKKESLLTYEQFEKEFENEKPHCSLLLNTGGAGYFAYCVIAPHKIRIGNEPILLAENAMVEVKKYLRKTTEDKRKKILVVDDSKVILQSMKELFEKDYQVSLAKSGLAAIRCITLDRPDLVLLDYEMPVCDGGQILKMIRSEEEMADIAVIFLTGRSDKESVEKVMSLKPAGYLLKTLRPAEIKENIDKYFKKPKAVQGR